MFTKSDALHAAATNAEIHFTGAHPCVIADHGHGRITRYRVNGRVQEWKTRPTDFRLPVKHGMYDHGAITPENAGCFHLAENCPAILENRIAADEAKLRASI